MGKRVRLEANSNQEVRQDFCDKLSLNLKPSFDIQSNFLQKGEQLLNNDFQLLRKLNFMKYLLK